MTKTTFIFSISIILFLIGGSLTVNAQNERNTQNSFDYASRSDLTVDPITHALQLQVPLGSYPQRGGGSLPVALSYSSKLWNLHRPTVTTCGPGGDVNFRSQALYAAQSKAGWTSGLNAPKFDSASENLDWYDWKGQPSTRDVHQSILRLAITLPDGSRHEMRSDDNVHPFSGYDPQATGIYYSTDGSRLILSGDTLYLPNGSRYLLHQNEYGQSVFVDPNGNQITYDSNQVTDTLGRVIVDPLASHPSNGGGIPATTAYALPGLGNQAMNYQMRWQNLSETGVISDQETDQTLKYRGDWVGSPCVGGESTGDALFHSETAEKQIFHDSVFNPIVLTQITLPNGQTYQFKYNVYGEISKVIYPTGAYERFTYAMLTGVSGWFDDTFNSQTNRGVTDRWISSDGTAATEQHYSYSDQGEVTNPDGTRTEYRYFQKPAGETIQLGFDNPLYGKIYETRQYASDGTTLVGRTLTDWTVDGTTSTNGFGYIAYKTRNPRPTRQISVQFEPGATSALATMSETVYETPGQNNAPTDPGYFAALNPRQSKSYHYAVLSPSTAAGGNSAAIAAYFSSANLARTSETDYLYDLNYKARGILNLPVETRIKDASGAVKAKSQIVYDDFTNYPLISAGTNAQWSDPGSTVVRGNAATMRMWSDIAGNQYVETHSQFDNFGNLRNSWDARGNVSSITYSSTYAYAYPTSATTDVPDATGQHGSSTAFTSSTVYDYATGLPTSMTDANGQTSTMEYNDPLLRPTKAIASNGQQMINEYGVGTSTATRFVHSKTQIDAVHWKEGYAWYDALGRTYKSQSVDSGGDVFTEKEFDALGRVYRVSNPFRAGETKQWTTNIYDSSNRVKEVDLPDSSKVLTAWGISDSGIVGITKQITDQAGRKRKGISDALGRMLRVVEDPDGQNLSTDYTFDILGNLRKTVQGEQSRYFMYDALGRLLYAKQPEQNVNVAFSGSGYTDPLTSNNQWSVKYEYDASGNITKTTDARNISIQGTYDNFNRLILRDYSDSTPDVSFYYDGTGLGTVPAFSKGKTTKVTSSVSENRYTSFDSLGRLLASEQRTPFDPATETIATAVPRTFQYSYNLSGALLEEVYPSGRVVKNTLDQDGALAQVQTKKNQNYGYLTYAGGIHYNAAGAVDRMQLGNGRWETAAYNNREQVTQIGLGATSADQNLLKLEFGYSTTGNADNNGAMLSQKITVPTEGLNTGFVNTQTYAYDSLNRLQSAQEKDASNVQTWKQTFQYDRYGNRRFDVANTTTLGTSYVASAVNPTISTANNRMSDNQGYTYDPNGNLTQDTNNPNTPNYVYDAESRQIAVKDSSSVERGVYIYDGEGRRVKKIAAGDQTIFVYDGAGQLAAEYSVQLSTAPQVSYLTTDHLGSPRVVTNQTGAITSRKDYNAYGDETLTSQRTTGLHYTPLNQPREVRSDYTGYQKDEESGLEYAQARYYNSAQGRFTSVDPLTASASIKDPQTFNRYTYGLNSPYKFTDPLGLAAQGPAGLGPPLHCKAEFGSCDGSDEYIDGELEHNQSVQNTYDVIAANRAIDNGDWDTAAAICAANENVQCKAQNTSVTVTVLGDDDRPYIGNMVENNEGVDFAVNPEDPNSPWINAEDRFRFGVGHDGEHVLGARNGSAVSAINGLTGIVLGKWDQGSSLYTVLILLEDKKTVLVLKDLINLSEKIQNSPNITKTGSGLFSKGKVRSKVEINAGDLIGSTRPWVGKTNGAKVGLHFDFVKFENIKKYRTEIANGVNNPLINPNFFVGTPCGSSSPARCK